MAKAVIELSEQEIMRVESILMDEDELEALRFIKEVLRSKLREKGSRALDRNQSTGMMT